VETGVPGGKPPKKKYPEIEARLNVAKVKREGKGASISGS